MIYESPRRGLPRWASTLVVVLVAVALLAPGPWSTLEKLGSTVLAPMQMGLSGTLGEIAGIVETVQRVRDLAEENRVYRDQLDQQQAELVRIKELEAENNDLRSLLSMKERAGPGALLPVSVIARDDTPYAEAITIDRGTTGGVHEGSVVVSVRGLVGTVARVEHKDADPFQTAVVRPAVEMDRLERLYVLADGK